MGWYVAPRRGAWIETTPPNSHRSKDRVSHPAGVRGLKPTCVQTTAVASWSHPAGVRGLKHDEQWVSDTEGLVAPRRGAWIEPVAALPCRPGAIRRTPQGCVD